MRNGREGSSRGKTNGFQIQRSGTSLVAELEGDSPENTRAISIWEQGQVESRK
jgi:hypothetical protein